MRSVARYKYIRCAYDAMWATALGVYTFIFSMSAIITITRSPTTASGVKTNQLFVILCGEGGDSLIFSDESP